MVKQILVKQTHIYIVKEYIPSYEHVRDIIDTNFHVEK